MDTKNYLIVDSVEKLEEAIARTREAQKVFATYTQEQVDKIFLAAASAADKARISLAKLAVEETGMRTTSASTLLVKLRARATTAAMSSLHTTTTLANLARRPTTLAPMTTLPVQQQLLPLLHTMPRTSLSTTCTSLHSPVRIQTFTVLSGMLSTLLHL